MTAALALLALLALLHPHPYGAHHIHGGSPTWERRWLPLTRPAQRVYHDTPGGWVTHPADQPCPECLEAPA